MTQSPILTGQRQQQGEDFSPETINRFLSLFPHRHNWIYAPYVVGVKHKWKEVSQYPIRNNVLAAEWADPFKLVGLRPGQNTAYLMLDIDRGSPYCSEKGVRIVRGVLESIGLVRSILIRSSESGGLHLYYPLPEKVSSFWLTVTVRHCLQRAGLMVAAGKLETFPNIKTWDAQFQAHRLPLQQGSYILDDYLQPVSRSIERFCDSWETAANHQDMDALNAAIARAKREKPHKRQQQRQNDRLRGKAAQFKADLERELAQGFTGSGQTNSLVWATAQYLYIFKNLTGVSLVDAMVETVTVMPGYTQHCGHQHEIRKCCKDKAQSIEQNPNYYPFGESKPGIPLPDPRATNEEKQQSAINRINAAVAQVKGKVFHTITELAEALRIAANCSKKTLYKYPDLWADLKSCVMRGVEPISSDRTPKEPPQNEGVCNAQSLDTARDTEHEKPIRSVWPSSESNFSIVPLPFPGGDLRELPKIAKLPPLKQALERVQCHPKLKHSALHLENALDQLYGESPTVAQLWVDKLCQASDQELGQLVFQAIAQDHARRLPMRS